MAEIKEIIKDEDRLYVGKDATEDLVKSRYSKVQPSQVHALAYPANHAEVVELVKYAEKHDLIVIARGGNTGATGAQVPINGNELMIDLSLMNKIIDLDEETMTLTVEPGVTIGEVQTYVEEHGFLYAPDPASKNSSIGGNVAMNAGGLRAVKYGTTRDNVREMTVVLINGETLTVGSLNIKDVSGYDLKDLFIGSEGTLGISTQIKLKLLPLPKYHLSAVYSFDDVIKASEASNAILRSGADPSAIELFEADALHYAEEHLGYNFQLTDGQAYILVQVDGQSMEGLVKRLELASLEIGNLSQSSMVLEDLEEEAKAWALRDAILVGLNKYTRYEMLDEVVPLNKFGQLIRYTRELQDKHGMRITNFGHSGDGNVHTLLMREGMSDEEWTQKRTEVLDDLYAKVAELGGLPSAEHGVGVTKRDYFLKMTDEVKVSAMRAVKKAFDPNNRLNPGKVL